MSDDYSEARLRFAYIFPEFARPDFKLPMDDKEREWAAIRTLFAGSRLINADNNKADTKGNKPMDEELFTKEAIKRLTKPEVLVPRNPEHYETTVMDIFAYTEHALKLQLAIVVAESHLEHAKQKHQEAGALLQDARQKRCEAATAVDDAKAKLENHLNAVRGTHVTLRGGLHE